MAAGFFVAGVLIFKPGEDLEEGRFARAVGADEPDVLLVVKR
jgi:hypothetical protein